jgi:hypothetical protein
VILLALDAVRSRPHLLDRLPQVVLDLLVRRRAHGGGGQVAVPQQLGVDVTRRLERFLQVVVEVVVVERTVDIRLHRVGCVVEPVLGFGHSARPFGLVVAP